MSKKRKQKKHVPVGETTGQNRSKQCVNMACHPPADTNVSSGGVPPEERRQPLEYRLRQKRRAFTERLAALRARLRHTHAPWRDNALVWWLLVLLTPVLLVLCAQLVALADGKAVALWFAACSEAAFLTYVLLLALEVLLLVLTGSLFVPTLMLSAVVLFLAIANHFKEAINGVPLMVSDIAMVGNVGDVADFLRPGMKLGAGIWQAVGIVAVLLVLTAIFALHPRANRCGWRVRLKTAIACVLVLVLSASYIPTRAFLDGTETDEAQAERNDRLGLLAGLYSGVLDSAVQEPNAYNENNMNGILMQVMHNAKPTPERTVQPNVILLMSESFCDPTVVLPGVEFHDDPIPNYHALARDWPSGTFQSNTYAGGTGNVEMEVMTGLPIGFLSESEDLTALADADSYDRVPSIVKAFAADGYATEFVHSYTPNLYHRTENLPKIGFQKVLFQDDFPKNEERKAGYLSDRALNRKLISEFEGREKDKPLLMFGLSVENHQPYFTGKFDTPSGVDFSCSELDTDGVGALDTLLHGIHDADEALGQLVDYFETRDEPVIVVFWGDHLPGLYLDDDHSVYSVTGYSDTANTKSWSPEMMKQMHSTQFLVWNNYGADLTVPETVSTLSMGTQILDWAGVPKPLYFSWVDTAIQDMLVCRERLYVSGDGTPYHTPPPEDRKTVEIYRSIVYDILYGERYIADKMTAIPELP